MISDGLGSLKRAFDPPAAILTGWANAASMTETSRRRLLAGLGSTITGVAVSGCLDDPPASTADDASSHATAEPPAADLPTTCPEYERVERVVCYDDVDTDDVDGFLDPSNRRVAPGETIEFTLYNRSDRRLATNFYNWVVHKHVDDEWHHVAPLGWNQPLMYVDPGDSHTWSLTVDNDDVEAGASVEPAGGTDDVTVMGLGGGHYAFRGRGWFEDESHESATAFAATFELDAEPLALTPTDAISDPEHEGDTLVAHSSRGDSDDDRARLAAFELERVDDPDDPPEPVILEQVVRREPLRDALALAVEHDADCVRIEEYDSATPAFGAHDDAVFEFQGSTYEVTTKGLESDE